MSDLSLLLIAEVFATIWRKSDNNVCTASSAQLPFKLDILWSLQIFLIKAEQSIIVA